MTFQYALLLTAIAFSWTMVWGISNCYGQAPSIELSKVREYRQSGLKAEALQLLNRKIDGELINKELLIEHARQSYKQESYKMSFLLFEKTLLLHPEANEVRIEYAGLLFNRNHWEAAESILLEYKEHGGRDASAPMMLGYLNLWQQKYKAAELHFREAVSIDPGNQAALNGLDEIERIKSLFIIGEYHYKSDDQPLYAHHSGVQLKQYLNSSLSPRLDINYFNFNNTEEIQNAYWLQIGNRFHWRDAKIFLDLQAGRFEKLKSTDDIWTSKFQLDKNWSNILHSGVVYSNSPYFSTTASIEQKVVLEQIKFYLNRPISMNWSGELAVVLKDYRDGNQGMDYYAWVMGTPFSTEYLDLKIGYGLNYSNIDSSRYVANKTIDEIISSGNYEDIDGVYNPYFTPNDQIIHSVVFNLNLQPLRWMEVSLGGNIGFYAQSELPYLYLAENGAFHVQRSFATTRENVWETHADVSFNLMESAIFNIGLSYHNLFFYEQIDFNAKFTLRF